MSKEKKEKASIFNILAFTFEGQDTADDVVKQIKKSGALDGQVILAEVVVEQDEKGKVHFHEPGHGTLGSVVGAVGGGLLGLIGGPAGLLAWTVGGAVVGGVAGKYLGRPFSKGEIKEIGEALSPNTSAFMLLVEDYESESIINKMDDFNANVITLTVGDELSGQIASYVSGEAYDAEGNVVVGEGMIAADAEGNVVAAKAGMAVDAEGNVVVGEGMIAADAEGNVVAAGAVAAAIADGNEADAGDSEEAAE